MGDGQHIWASAEWVLMLIHCFVREEGERLVIGSGIAPQWLQQEETLSVGPVQTIHGPISIQIEPNGGHPRIHWQAQWRATAPMLEIALPGRGKINISSSTASSAIID